MVPSQTIFSSIKLTHINCCVQLSYDLFTNDQLLCNMDEEKVLIMYKPKSFPYLSVIIFSFTSYNCQAGLPYFSQCKPKVNNASWQQAQDKLTPENKAEQSETS